MTLKPYTENGRAAIIQGAWMTGWDRVATVLHIREIVPNMVWGQNLFASQSLSEKLAFLIKCLSNFLWTWMGLRFALGNQLPTCPITHTLSCQLSVKGLVTFNQTFFSFCVYSNSDYLTKPFSYQDSLTKVNLRSGLLGSISLMCMIIRLWYMLTAKLSKKFSLTLGTPTWYWNKIEKSFFLWAIKFCLYCSHLIYLNTFTLYKLV